VGGGETVIQSFGPGAAAGAHVDSLLGATAYTFTVVALNANGGGQSSPPSAAITTTGPAVSAASVDGAGQSGLTRGAGAVYPPGATRTITYTLTNTGDADLYDVGVTNSYIFGDAPVAGFACTFPGDSAPTAGTLDNDIWNVDWAASYVATAWLQGVSFTCTATLTLNATDAPLQSFVRAWTDTAPAGSIANATWEGPGARADYWAFTGGISVLKTDLATGATADTPDTAAGYPAGSARTVRWRVSNIGVGTWLTDIDVTDTVTDGPAIGAWFCDLSALGGPPAYSFVDNGPWIDGTLGPGEFFDCTGSLMLAANQTHADIATASATIALLEEGDVPASPVPISSLTRSDVRVSGDNPFHARIGVAAAVPALTPWMLAVLMLLLGGLGWRARRRA
jgi:hypothetical protein